MGILRKEKQKKKNKLERNKETNTRQTVIEKKMLDSNPTALQLIKNHKKALGLVTKFIPYRRNSQIGHTPHS